MSMTRNLMVGLMLLATPETLPCAAQPPKTPATVDRYGDPLPPGALARLGTMRLRHVPSIEVGFSPDGKLLATASYGSLRFWDLANGRLVRQVHPEKDSGFESMTVAPHGRWLAVVSGQRILLLDPATGGKIGWLEIKEKGTLHGLFVAPDGKRLAVIAGNNSVLIWDVGAENLVGRLPILHLSVPNSFTRSVRFAADGTTIQTTSFARMDPQIQHWDAQTGKLLKVVDPPALGGFLRFTNLSPDGRRFVLGKSSPGLVQMVDAETGKELYKLASEDKPGMAVFTPDSRIMAVLFYTTPYRDLVPVRFYDLQTGKVVREFSLPVYGSCLAFAPDGQTLLTFGQIVALGLWDAKTGKRKLGFDAHDAWIRTLAFTPDSRTLVSGGGDGTIRVWEAATGKPLRVLPGPRLSANEIAVLPDGRAVLSCGADAELRLQDLETGRELRRLTMDLPKEDPSIPHRVSALRLSPDGKTVAAFGSASQPAHHFHLWDLSTGRLIARRTFETRVPFHAFSPDPRIVLEWLHDPSSDGKKAVDPNIKRTPPAPTTLVLRNLVTGRHLLSVPQPDEFWYCYAFSPDEFLLATVTRKVLTKAKYQWEAESTIRVWELATGKERLAITIDPKEFTSTINRMTFSADGRLLATVREDMVIQLWDVGMGKELLRHTGHDERTFAIGFAPDGRSLATGHEDGTILVWDISKAQPERGEIQATPKDLERWWRDLADDDARIAHRAIASLSAVPNQSLPLLRENLKPLAPVPADRLEALIADLESAVFKRREAAARVLAELGDQAFPALEQALAKKPSEEARRRIEILLNKTPVVSPNALRTLRAIEVMESIGSVEARKVLANLSLGDPAARITQTAQRVLKLPERR